MKKTITKQALKVRELTTTEHDQISGGVDLGLVSLGGVRPGSGPRPGGTNPIVANTSFYTPFLF